MKKTALLLGLALPIAAFACSEEPQTEVELRDTLMRASQALGFERRALLEDAQRTERNFELELLQRTADPDELDGPGC